MQISLAWTVDSPITSYFFSFALTAPCCAWALAQWRCMGVYVCVSVCRGDFFFLLVCKFGGRQIWVCMHEWMFGSVCMCVCVPCVCVGIWLPDTWLCLVLALCSAHQMFSFFIILHLHRVLWGFLRICAAHIQLALLFSAVLWVKTKCSSKPFYFLSLKEEGYYKQQLSKLHLDSKLCANNSTRPLNHNYSKFYLVLYLEKTETVKILIKNVQLSTCGIVASEKLTNINCWSLITEVQTHDISRAVCSLQVYWLIMSFCPTHTFTSRRDLQY